MNARPLAVAGMFYPEDGEEIARLVAHAKKHAPALASPPRALIVPHAGYIYSGITASLAYASCGTPKRVVVIGPSHRVRLNGASVAQYAHVPTPCGILSIDTDFCTVLQQEFDWLGFFPAAHHEHSTEVQMPLLKCFFPQTRVVEIVYGALSHEALANLVRFCLEKPETLVVISTDLSHFYPLDQAKEKDSACIEAIKALHVKELEKCEACGITGVKALVEVAASYPLTPSVLEYRTSFERNGDANSVVGYVSVAFS